MQGRFKKRRHWIPWLRHCDSPRITAGEVLLLGVSLSKDVSKGVCIEGARSLKIRSITRTFRIIGYRDTRGVVKKLEYFVLLNFTFVCSTRETLIATVCDLAENTKSLQRRS